MSGLPIGLVIEGLVALLLLITIGFCIALNRRIRMLRADEQMLRSVIGDLNSATIRAENAIAGLRVAAKEASEALSGQMRDAEDMAHELRRSVESGESVVTRIAAITRAAAPAPARKGRAA